MNGTTPRQYSADHNENLAYRTGFAEGLRACLAQDSGQPERELVSLLKDVLHCSDVFVTFRPDIHAKLMEFSRQLRAQQKADEFAEHDEEEPPRRAGANLQGNSCF